MPFDLILWGFALVSGSFAFVYLGYQIDQILHTAPFFMIGLFLLAVMICIGRFYQIVWRKWAQQELIESERRLYSILQGSPIPTFVLGKDHRVIYWNRAIEVLTKIRAKDVLSTTHHWKAFYKTQRPCVADLLVDEALDAIPRWYATHCTKSKLIEEAYEGMDFFPDLGEKGKWMRFTAAVIRDSAGNLMGAVESLEDITEQKQAEEELIKIKKLESLGILADGIAHDFGSLLSSILRNIFLAKISVTEEDKILEQGLEIAEKASLRAKELTNRLITFSKGGNPIRKASQLAPLLRDAAERLVHETNVRCQFSLPDDLWNVDIDENQIRQVVQNLLNNAMEAMPDGGVVFIHATNIVVSSDDGLPVREGKYVKWSVEDQGVGIPQEHRDKLFEPYFTTKRKSDSTGIGLGLATCYAIIKRHDGIIDVKSEPQVGTIVDVYLPAAPINDAILSDHMDATGKSRERVLVMDQDAVMRDAVEIILHYLGYDCDFSRNMDETLRHYLNSLASRPYKFVILDSSFTDHENVENILHALLDIDPQVNAILAGNDIDQFPLAEFRSRGFSGVVVRPYTIDSLKAALNPQA